MPFLRIFNSSDRSRPSVPVQTKWAPLRGPSPGRRNATVAIGLPILRPSFDGASSMSSRSSEEHTWAPGTPQTDVLVRVGDPAKDYRIETANLARASKRFVRCLNGRDETQSMLRLGDTVTGMPLYCAPPEVTSQGLEQLMDAIANLDAYISSWHPPSDVLALIQTARHLECPAIVQAFPKLLRLCWDKNVLPHSYTPPSLAQAVFLLALSREEGFHKRRPLVTTHAVYAICSNDDYCDALVFNMPYDYLKGLADADKRLVKTGHTILRECLGPLACGNPPGGSVQCQARLPNAYLRASILPRGCVAEVQERRELWNRFMPHGSSRDPLRWDPTKGRQEQLERLWCSACVEEWRREWKKAQGLVWEMFSARMGKPVQKSFSSR